MKIETQKRDNAFVLAVSGRLDSQTVMEAEKEVTRWLDAGETKIVCDLSGLEYISSAGLRLILVAAKRLKAAGGGFCLCGVQGPIQEILDIAGFTKIIPIRATVDEALASVVG